MECPSCGDEFDSEQGVRIHHSHIHGVSLPNRMCKGCGGRFYDPDSKLDYCDDCNPSAGETNGNWKNATETTTCKRCADEFEYYPSDKDDVYCPTCVEEADEFLGDPHWEGVERVEKDCEWCKTTMTVLASRLERDGQRFCSQDCHGSWLSENVVGEDHHQWEGGTLNYSGDWWQVRRRGVERDDHSCQRCGKSGEEIGREPDVHHIERARFRRSTRRSRTGQRRLSLPAMSSTRRIRFHRRSSGVGLTLRLFPDIYIRTRGKHW